MTKGSNPTVAHTATPWSNDVYRYTRSSLNSFRNSIFSSFSLAALLNGFNLFFVLVDKVSTTGLETVEFFIELEKSYIVKSNQQIILEKSGMMILNQTRTFELLMR